MPLFDYFRAPDADAVRQALDAGGGATPVGAVFDGIEAKGVDPSVVLAMMVAAVRQVPWSADLVDDRLVWPVGVEQDPEYDGPWVSELNTSARDVLAGAGDLPRVAREWARIEELGGNVDVADAQVFVESVVDLARRAREADEPLFCWISL
ncbi:hypothetical protein [Amycolatopsis sp. Hca4]|uniref:hypothetical protein n=1 Tax=Amycolatopsis sp. Hca4 TaxID=2742131 RepID=UPI0015911611|nr:hypothetical protein [Amycolatopsis sp. Hca4]QKV79748.1 hypothetical protein HUT10_42595 [Amycolatopsis sp. Hca4]